MEFLADLVLVAVLIAAAVTDLRTGRIYNRLLYPALVVGLGLGVVAGAVAAPDHWAGALAGLKNHAYGAGLAFVVMFLCFALGGMGGGDVKLMTVVGAFTGLNHGGQSLFIVWAIFYSFAIGATIGILVALWRRALPETVLRTWWALRVLALPGNTLQDAQFEKPGIRVPFGFATAVGTVWLLAENYSGVSLASLVGRLWG
jgi:prepilin peptidase CpaA